MCGIFGVITAGKPLSHDQKQFVMDCLITGQVRGDEGTGLALRSATGVQVHKRALCGMDFLASRVGERAFRDLADADVVIGHHRKTTSGGQKDRDCHPYEYSNLVGVHNGGIPFTVLSDLKTEGAVCSVDSAKLYAAINNAKRPTDVLSKVHDGAYAMVWLDTAKNAMNLVKNDKRPLWAANGPAGWYYASEPGMLAWLMTRNRLHDDSTNMWSLQNHTLYTLDLNNRTKFRVKKFDVETPPVRSIYEEDSWYTRRGPAYGHAPPAQVARFYGDPSKMAEELPGMEDEASLIMDAINSVDDEMNDQGKAMTGTKLVDVVITDVKRQSHGQGNLVDIYGYLNYYNEDLSCFVSFKSYGTQDTGNYMIIANEKAKDAGQALTARIKVNTIKVSASGTCLIMGTFQELHDQEFVIDRDQEFKMGELFVESATGPDLIGLNSAQIAAMWDKLKAPPAIIDRTTH